MFAVPFTPLRLNPVWAALVAPIYTLLAPHWGT